MTAPSSTKDVTRYILIAIALTAVAALRWEIADALVISFGGIVFGTVLHSMATPIARWTGWSPRAGVAVALVQHLYVEDTLENGRSRRSGSRGQRG